MKKYAKKLIALVLAVCLLASVMPVAMAGPESVIYSPIELEITAKRGADGDSIELLYQAITWINEFQVAIVLANRDKVAKLEKLRYECDLQDEVIMQLPDGYELPEFYFSSAQVGPGKDELFIPEGVPYVMDGHLYLYYKLNPKVVEELFSTMDETELRYDLMRPMGMSLFTDLPESVPNDILKGTDPIHTSAEIRMRNNDGTNVPVFNASYGVMARGDKETTLTDLPVAEHATRTVLRQDSEPFMEGYPDNTFKPDGAITRAEVAQVLSRRLDAPATKSSVSFTDVDPDAWYAEAVTELAGLGYLKGSPDGSYRPDAPITRAEMAALLVRFAEGEAEDGPTFSDVPETHWAYDAINTAAAYGWINGVGGGRFSPDRPITRAEAAKLICAVLERSPDKAAVIMGMARQFTDVDASHWAYLYIADATTARETTTLGSFEIWTAAK